ncbi:MAG: hypothetical protein U0003_01950 [Vampirovibrionales bacterium]
MKNPALIAVALATTLAFSSWSGLVQAEEMNSSLRPYGGTTTYSNTPNYSQPSYDPYSYNSNTATYSQPSYGYSMQQPLQGRVSTIPKGSTLNVRMDQPLSSNANKLGESVSGTVDAPLIVDNQVIIPTGSRAVGQIVSIVPTRHLGRHGEVTVRFYEIKTPDGNTIPIQGYILTDDNTGRFKGDSYAMDTVKGVGTAAGGTALGAVSGTAIGGLLGVAGTGAVVGTGIGAVAGIGYAVTRKGKEVMVPSGTRFNIRVDEDTSSTRP